MICSAFIAVLGVILPYNICILCVTFFTCLSLDTTVNDNLTQRLSFNIIFHLHYQYQPKARQRFPWLPVESSGEQWRWVNDQVFTLRLNLFIPLPSLHSASPPGSPAVRPACCQPTGARGWVWVGRMSPYLRGWRPFHSDWCSRTALLSKPCF